MIATLQPILSFMLSLFGVLVLILLSYLIFELIRIVARVRRLSEQVERLADIKTWWPLLKKIPRLFK